MNLIILTATSVVMILSLASSKTEADDLSRTAINDDTNYQQKPSINHLLFINQLDAPKYYDLNGLLYKKTSSSSSSFGSESDGNTQAIRPRDRIGDNDDAEEKSAADVDELIRSMRRRTSNGAANEDSGANDDSIRGDRRPIEPNLREEDEATIQRKSTNIERDSSELSPDSDQSSPADAAGTSSRLREANGKLETDKQTNIIQGTKCLTFEYVR